MLLVQVLSEEKIICELSAAHFANWFWLFLAASPWWTFQKSLFFPVFFNGLSAFHGCMSTATSSQSWKLANKTGVLFSMHLV